MSIAGIDESPESKILKAVVALIRADVNLSAAFKPIRMLESTTREAFANYGAWSMVVQPVNLRPDPKPSQRETEWLSVVISAFMPNEQTEEDSTLDGLDLGNYLRKMLWGFAVPYIADPTKFMTFATTDFKMLPPLLGSAGATRILSYQALFQTDVDPVQGDFSA